MRDGENLAWDRAPEPYANRVQNRPWRGVKKGVLHTISTRSAFSSRKRGGRGGPFLHPPRLSDASVARSASRGRPSTSRKIQSTSRSAPSPERARERASIDFESPRRRPRRIACAGAGKSTHIRRTWKRIPSRAYRLRSAALGFQSTPMAGATRSIVASSRSIAGPRTSALASRTPRAKSWTRTAVR